MYVSGSRVFFNAGEAMKSNDKFLFFDSLVSFTQAGTPYLKEAGVALISRPSIPSYIEGQHNGIQRFIDGFESSLGMVNPLQDTTCLDPPDALCKFAGQLCYLSFDKNSTKNKDAGRYFDNIKLSGHGSVIEHANFTFLFWGVDRSVTHELVRHRSGCSYSQVSQRYVDGGKLRFVERPEYQPENCPAGATAALQVCFRQLHDEFVEEIDRAREKYEERAKTLSDAREQGHPFLQAAARTDRRKQVNQTARDGLPNCTEAPIVMTANARALRHMIEMRASKHADVQIRNLFKKVAAICQVIAPHLFSDYVDDGEGGLTTPYRKV